MAVIGDDPICGEQRARQHRRAHHRPPGRSAALMAKRTADPFGSIGAGGVESPLRESREWVLESQDAGRGGPGWPSGSHAGTAGVVSEWVAPPPRRSAVGLSARREQCDQQKGSMAHPGFRLPSPPTGVCRSCARDDSANAVIAPMSASYMSHCVSARVPLSAKEVTFAALAAGERGPELDQLVKRAEREAPTDHPETAASGFPPSGDVRIRISRATHRRHEPLHEVAPAGRSDSSPRSERLAGPRSQRGTTRVRVVAAHHEDDRVEPDQGCR